MHDPSEDLQRLLFLLLISSTGADCFVLNLWQLIAFHPFVQVFSKLYHDIQFLIVANQKEFPLDFYILETDNEFPKSFTVESIDVRNFSFLFVVVGRKQYSLHQSLFRIPFGI